MKTHFHYGNRCMWHAHWMHNMCVTSYVSKNLNWLDFTIADLPKRVFRLQKSFVWENNREPYVFACTASTAKAFETPLVPMDMSKLRRMRWKNVSWSKVNFEKPNLKNMKKWSHFASSIGRVQNVSDLTSGLDSPCVQTYMALSFTRK